jgi:predicted nucleic acid-binding Zn ribbon protein
MCGRWKTVVPSPGEDATSDSIGSVLRGVLSEPKLRRGLSLGRLARRWDEVVGSKLAAETWPAGLEDATLVVAASSSAWATQARFLAEDIRRRAAEVTGSPGIRIVRVVVRPEGAKPQVRKGSSR